MLQLDCAGRTPGEGKNVQFRTVPRTRERIPVSLPKEKH